MRTPNDIILKRPIRCKVNTYSETYVTLGRASLVIKSQGVLRTIRRQYDTAAGKKVNHFCIVIMSQGVLRTIRGQCDTAAALSIPAECRVSSPRYKSGSSSPRTVTLTREQ